MFNILITDDEQIVIDSISFILEKNFQNQVNIFKANSGENAIQISNENKIDIVFMDINMPGINGLETISRIKECNSNAIIIILSAFDRFQYAQEAISLGAFKYLTKPVNRNLIVKTVRDAMTHIDNMRGKITNEIEIRKKLNSVSPLVESDFIYSALFEEENHRDLTSALEYFNIETNYWFFCCIEIPKISTMNKNDLYLKIRDILSSHCECIVGSVMINRIVVFVPIDDSSPIDETSKMMNQIFRNIYAKLSIKVCTDIRIGISSVGNGYKTMLPFYNEALYALNKTSNQGGIEFYSNKTEVTNNVFDRTDADEIVKKIQTGDIRSIQSLTSLYIEKLYNAFYNNQNKIKNSLFELLVNARNSILAINPKYENIGFDNAFTFFSECNDKNELSQFVKMRLTECASAFIEVNTKQMNPIIKKAYSFIENNLTENISLEQTASVVQVNPFYLSKLFKEQTGENFIDYVTNLRLDKAKEMLSKDEYSIKEISHNCGYSDQNYFSKLFKKKFNLSPTEYKNSFITKEEL